jgi:lipoprotein-releasing system permease protein
LSFEYFIGSRYLRSKQEQRFISLITFLSVAGVTVGVMALIVVIAVMSGFENDLKTRILGVKSHIVLERESGDFTDYPQVMEYLKTLDGIESATPVIHTQTMLKSAAGAAGTVLRGIDPASAGQVNPNLEGMVLKQMAKAETRHSDKQGLPVIILGKELARSLGVLEGDEIYLISPRGRVSPAGHLPSMKRFLVAGFFESGMYEFDGAMAFVHIQEARKMLRMGDAVNAVEIRVNRIFEAKEISRRIIDHLGPGYRAKDWMEMNRTFFSALKLEKTTMFVILTLIILVAAFNIAGSLIMMVMEKTRDIAILKAMGATDQSIRKIFVFKGVMIGSIGTCLGALLGTTLCMLLKRYRFVELPSDVYYITQLPVQLAPADVLMTAGAAMLICLAASLYPARQAANLDPVEAIRYG